MGGKGPAYSKVKTEGRSSVTQNYRSVLRPIKRIYHLTMAKKGRKGKREEARATFDAKRGQSARYGPSR